LRFTESVGALTEAVALGNTCNAFTWLSVAALASAPSSSNRAAIAMRLAGSPT
jgi:hypothetical protein